ncbi:MAG: acyltransferase [Vibrionaceae bacterium]|nr:acyltransferase [Vibrionaceae bacterium]
MNSKRLLELDGLRGIAALFVVLYHFFYRYNEIYGHNFEIYSMFYYGKFGVHLFFIISGFVIIKSVENSTFFEFAKSRFLRLYPIYWVCMIITFLCVSIFTLEGREVTFLQATMNLLMFQTYLKVPNVDGVYWTLAVELNFYFIISIIYLCGFRRQLNAIFSIILLCSILNNLNVVSIPVEIRVVLLFDYIAMFLFGIIVYNAKFNNKKMFSFENILLVSLITYDLFVKYNLFQFVTVLLLMILFLFSVFYGFNLLKWNGFVYLGGISYSLYLIHQNIGYIIINKLYENVVFKPYMVIFVVVTIISLAHILHTKVELKLNSNLRPVKLKSYSA